MLKFAVTSGAADKFVLTIQCEAVLSAIEVTINDITELVQHLDTSIDYIHKYTSENSQPENYLSFCTEDDEELDICLGCEGKHGPDIWLHTKGIYIPKYGWCTAVVLNFVDIARSGRVNYASGSITAAIVVELPQVQKLRQYLSDFLEEQ